MSVTNGKRPRLDDAEFRRLVAEAKSGCLLSSVVERHTTLNKRGRSEMVGLCPFHPERSPSFEVNDAKGLYHCHGCGASGDHFRFLREKDGLRFFEAYTALTNETFPLVTPEQRAQREREQAAATARRIEAGRRVWMAGNLAAGTLAEVYIRSRGITAPLPDTVRFARLPYRDQVTGTIITPEAPVAVCALQDVAGKVVGVQRIYLAPNGRGKMDVPKPKLSLGIIVGSAFRASGSIAPDGDTIVSCEGPEDGLTLAQGLPGSPVWVAAGTALLKAMVFPAGIRSVTIGADRDVPGEVAALTAAAAYAAAGVSARIIRPAPGFKDFNAELRGIRA